MAIEEQFKEIIRADHRLRDGAAFCIITCVMYSVEENDTVNVSTMGRFDEGDGWEETDCMCLVDIDLKNFKSYKPKISGHWLFIQPMYFLGGTEVPKIVLDEVRAYYYDAKKQFSPKGY